MAFPNTNSNILRGTQVNSADGRTTSGLSTNIIIKVGGIAVGALQNLTVTQTRPLQRLNEIGTDGNIEIVPNSATTFDLEATRIVFDQLRLPEAFSRSFRFINAQRIPFDIEVFDISNATEGEDISGNITVMKFVSCWFNRYTTPYQADNYIISETATIWAETGYVSSGSTIPGLRGDIGGGQTDATTGIESNVNRGGRRGAIDAAGIINAVFE